MNWNNLITYYTHVIGPNGAKASRRACSSTLGDKPPTKSWPVTTANKRDAKLLHIYRYLFTIVKWEYALPCDVSCNNMAFSSTFHNDTLMA